MSEGNGNIPPAIAAHKPGRTDTNTAKNLQVVAKALDEVLNPMREQGIASTGFCLLVFGFDAPGISNYVSNAKREDMIESLKETVKRLEANQDNVRFGDEHVQQTYTDRLKAVFAAGVKAGEAWEKLGPIGQVHIDQMFESWKSSQD